MLRRLGYAWIGIAALAIALMAAGTAPATAAATTRACPAIYPQPEYCRDRPGEYRTAPLSHQGWTYLNLYYCPPGMACVQGGTDHMPGWRWTGSTWSRTSLPGGWVYVYPYSGSWRWAWTSRSGWVAVQGGRFEIRGH